MNSRLGHLIRPRPISDRHSMLTLSAGFLIEGGTEVVQLVSLRVHSLSVGGPYYVTFACMLLGFYLFYLGLGEWARLHPRTLTVPDDRVPGSSRRPFPREGVALYVGGVAATAVLNIGIGGLNANGTPFVLAWLAGGLVVLIFGGFFRTLEKIVRDPVNQAAHALGLSALFWGLGVSVVAGLVLGERGIPILIAFFSNWSKLTPLIPPFVDSMSPLFVAYALLAIAYGIELSKTRHAPVLPLPSAGAD